MDQQVMVGQHSLDQDQVLPAHCLGVETREVAGEGKPPDPGPPLAKYKDQPPHSVAVKFEIK